MAKTIEDVRSRGLETESVTQKKNILIISLCEHNVRHDGHALTVG